MITHHDQRRLDAIIRSAVLSVFREFLAPIVETEEFHTRLASTIAARCVMERVPKPAMTRPIKPIHDANDAREAKRARQREWKRKNDAKKRAAKVGLTPDQPGVDPKIAEPSTHGAIARLPSPDEFLAEAMREAAAAAFATMPAPMVIGVDLASRPDIQVTHHVALPIAAADGPPQEGRWQPVGDPRMRAQKAIADLTTRNKADRADMAAVAPKQSKPAPTVITTTTKDVRAWLIASMKAGGLTQIQAEDRVGFMTHDQALAEANQRRARAGHPPFAFLGARSAA